MCAFYVVLPFLSLMLSFPVPVDIPIQSSDLFLLLLPSPTFNEPSYTDRMYRIPIALGVTRTREGLTL